MFTAFLASHLLRIHTPEDLDFYGKLRCVCLWAAASWLHDMDEEGLIMSDEGTDRIAWAMQIFFDTYQELASRAVAARRLVYKIRPKLHYMTHLRRTLMRTKLNPRKLGNGVAVSG